MPKSEVVSLKECHYTFGDEGKNNQNDEEGEDTRTTATYYPEGGWGFVVWAGLGLTLMITCGEVMTTTILFSDYLVQISGSNAAAFNLLMVTSTCGVIFSGVGVYLLNRILNKTTTRIACIVGALLFNCGDLILIWMTSSFHFILANGILKDTLGLTNELRPDIQTEITIIYMRYVIFITIFSLGLSFGIIITVQIKVFNGYFMKLRVTMMSLAMIFPCLTGMGFPLLVAYLKENMGLKGTIIIILATNMNLICCACAMVEYNPKLVFKKASKLKIDKLMMVTANEVDNECKPKEKISSGNSLEKSSNSFQIRIWLLKVFSEAELKFLFDPLYINICIGVSLVQLSEIIFLPVLPIILLTIFNESDSAVIMSIGNAGELVSKLVMASISYRVQIDNRLAFFIAMISVAILRTVLIQSTGYLTILISCVGIAITRAILQITWQFVLVDYSGNKNVVSAETCFQIVWMASLLTGNYIVSLVRDSTQGLSYSIHTLNIFNCVCIILWVTEFCIKRLARR